MQSLRAWVLLTFGDDRGWGGNAGYKDDPTRLYRYDNFVPNHRQLRAGDVALIRSKEQMLGVAEIKEIRESQGQKERYRCPECGTGHIWRRLITADYRCSKGHVFVVPVVTGIQCTNYEADFGTSFVATPAALSLEELRDACLSYNQQLAMQRIDLTMLMRRLAEASPAAGILVQGGYIDKHAGAINHHHDGDDGYTPSSDLLREEVFRSILSRRGQQRFRDRLRQRYGAVCMVSGCTVFDVVEAAHISPFRSTRDNHPENGLLLRADLHTLFDLDLLGVDPERLTVHLHASVRPAGYGQFDGTELRCVRSKRPSRTALAARWVAFQARVGAGLGLDVQSA